MSPLHDVRRRVLRRALRGALRQAALASVLCAGCDVVTSVGPQTCDYEAEENPIVTYRGGSVEGGIYMSSPWDGELVDFPGGARVRFEHGLGRVPRTFTAYVSFDPDGTRGDGSLAPGAGNQVELEAMDDVSLTLRNSSCADYFVLVTAEAPLAPDGSGG